MASVAHVALNNDFFPIEVLEGEGLQQVGKRQLHPVEAPEEFDFYGTPLRSLLLLSPFEIIEVEAVEEQEEIRTENPDEEIVRSILALLTYEQQDVLLRVVVNGESLQKVARTHGVVEGDIRVGVSCALDVIANADMFLPCIAVLVDKGRQMGF